MKNLFWLIVLFISSLSVQAQSLTVEGVTLKRMANGQLRIDVKSVDGPQVLRLILVNRKLDDSKDTKYDETEILIENNGYNQTWDGIDGTYEIIVITTIDRINTTKKGKIKF